MNRNWLNLFVDGLTALGAFGLMLTGLLMYFVLPPGRGKRITLLELDRHDWGEVHLWIAFGVMGLALLHIALHWQWVCTMCCRIVAKGATTKRSRLIAGTMSLVLLVGIVVGLLAWADAIKVESLSTGGSGAGDGGGLGGGGGGGRHGWVDRH